MCFYMAMDCCPSCVCAVPQRAKVAIPSASQASVCGDSLSEEVGSISCRHYLIVFWQKVYLAQAPAPSTPALSFCSPSHGRSRSVPDRFHHLHLDSILQPCLSCLTFKLTLVKKILKQVRVRIVIFLAFLYNTDHITSQNDF